MDITALEYFKIIAESGSLTKAAQQLHITQPAMSTMLNSVMRVDGDYYAAGTGRVDGCGGALLPDGSAVLEGVSQEI